MQLTDSTANMMISTLSDPEQPFTPELEKTASSVTGCLTNVLKSAAGSSQDDIVSAVTPPSPEVKVTSTVTCHRDQFHFCHQFRMGQFK